MPPNNYQLFLTACYEPACVAEGTLITLAAPILFIDNHGEKLYTVTTLEFSDGTTVDMIDEHGFWDVGLNRYVFLHSDAAKYIGHSFIGQRLGSDGVMTQTEVKLVGVVNRQRTTVAYSPVTYSHLCYYVNGMLSVPGATEGLINIFDVDGDLMKIDAVAFSEDIGTYGLFTYDDFAGRLPEEIFDAFNVKYMKVSLGKGLITWETIDRLIERYAAYF